MNATLVIFKSNGQRKDFPLSGSGAVIGRSEDCDLQVPLASVSRRHCELTISGNSVKAKDLASANGTYVNNKRINETELRAGDRLVVGPIVFTMQIDGQPEEILPVKTRGQVMAETGETGAEVVDLEVDVVAHPMDEAASLEAAAAVATNDEVDPISALEALAAEDDEEEES